MRLTSFVALSLLVVACGTPPDNSDAGDIEGGADAGGADAGSAANPNEAAVGTWTVAGVEASACGLNLRAGITGTAVAPPSTRGFQLQLASTFNGFTMIFLCEFAEGAKTYTCADNVKSMSLGASCNVNGGLRNISGSIDGTSAQLSGEAYTTGSGSGCQPTVHCGPRSLAVTATIAPPSPAP